MISFREGDRVRYIGPPPEKALDDGGFPNVVQGRLGWIIDEDPPETARMKK